VLKFKGVVSWERRKEKRGELKTREERRGKEREEKKRKEKRNALAFRGE
jgi:hypothetical protein